MNQTIEDYKLGIYKATAGEYAGAAIFLVDVANPDESDFIYFTIFNPESEDTHELTEQDWQEISEADGLKWESEIPLEIKDKFLFKKSFAGISGL